MRRSGIAGCAVIALFSCGAAAADGPVTELHAIFDEYWEYSLQRDPTRATYLGDHRYGSELRDYSKAAELEHAEALRGFLERVRAVERGGLSAEDALSASIFEELLATDIEGYRFRWWETSVSQQSGLYLRFPQLVRSHPFDTVEHCEDFLNRLDLFPSRLRQVEANLREGMAVGNVPFRGNVEGAIAAARELAGGSTRGHPLADAIERFAPEIPEPERNRLRDGIYVKIKRRIFPAYGEFLKFLEEEYLPACRTEPGVHALPDGAERYAFLVRLYTTTELSPEEIHELGLREMKRIRSEMREIVERVEFDGDLDAFFDHLRNDPEYYHETKEALLQEFREILAVMDEKLPELFGRLPETPYDLTEIEAYRAPSAPAAYYYSPPDDGSRPGYFYVNTYDLASRPRYTMEALAYHEAVPGHHLQIALARELDLPDFRRHRGFTAFSEGWGLYSERLPKEVGLYADPYSDFGRLTFEAWRASRLVVDTGIHALGWSRERALQYLESNTALARHDIGSEIDRYIAWPGQALAYKIGELRILELRAKAEKKLGERFDVRAFHDALLENGALPLGVLERIVDAWISETANKTP